MQSHAENAFYRYKRIIGGRLRAKNDDAQKREAAIGCAIPNRMFEMGEPLSYVVGQNSLSEGEVHMFSIHTTKPIILRKEQIR